MNRLLRLFFPDIPGGDEAATIDHVKPKRKRRKKDWRDQAVKAAATKHGKPFLCAADGVPREVLLGTEEARTVVVKSEHHDASVTQLKRKAK